MDAVVRRPVRTSLLVAAGLVAAVTAMFLQVVDTGFWSPEDLSELARIAASQARGESPGFVPSLAGGYATNPVLSMEFRVFGLEAWPYYVVNLIAHALNSLLAYFLVVTLLHDRRSAAMAAVLFALGVGSYGKNLMIALGVSSLVHAMTVLLGTLLYVLNEKRSGGRVTSGYALGFYALFVSTLFMRFGTFSMLACFAFYNLFFRPERQRPVLHTNLLVCLALALVAWLARTAIAPGASPDVTDTAAFLRNLPGYLILMVFPLHQSQLLETAPPLVRAVYAAAPVIRVLVGLAILSYSLFGFVFGSRALRFYIAWMYVMIVPFAFLRFPADWLNLRFLYLVSLGFCVVLTTGTLYGVKLLSHRGWRRFIPLAIPAAYIVLTAMLVRVLDLKNEQLARSPETRERLAHIRTPPDPF
jgi:hypothetical protein